MKDSSILSGGSERKDNMKIIEFIVHDQDLLEFDKEYEVTIPGDEAYPYDESGRVIFRKPS
jgi:hypothetical protein